MTASPEFTAAPVLVEPAACLWARGLGGWCRLVLGVLASGKKGPRGQNRHGGACKSAVGSGIRSRFHARLLKLRPSPNVPANTDLSLIADPTGRAQPGGFHMLVTEKSATQRAPFVAVDQRSCRSRIAGRDPTPAMPVAEGNPEFSGLIPDIGPLESVGHALGELS